MATDPTHHPHPRVAGAVRRATLALLAMLPLVAEAPARAGSVFAPDPADSLRVCTWSGMHRASFRGPRTQQLTALDNQATPPWWPVLVDDLAEDRCDVAVFGITSPEPRVKRRKGGKAAPVRLAVAELPRSSYAVKTWAEIDQAGLLVAVPAGSVMEIVMAGGLQHAKLVVVKPAAQRSAALSVGTLGLDADGLPARP